MFKKYFILLLSIFSLYSCSASNSDHILLLIGNCEIELRWDPHITDFENKSNIYKFLNLIASNYHKLRKTSKTIFINCIQKNGKYKMYFYEDNEAGLLSSRDSFPEVENEIITKIGNVFQISNQYKSFINLYLLAIPIDKDSSDFPDYSDYAELYYGPAPGTMQEIADGTLYYLYFFFNPDKITELLKDVSSFNGIIQKREISHINVDTIFNLTPVK